MKLIAILAILLVGCTNHNQSSITPNRADQLAKPYVLLISLDGYRWDYNQKFKPPFLSKFASESARLKSLRPSFPTKTFPNHLSIVTGRYPAKHGIIANGFYDPALDRIYKLRDKKAVRDGVFYQSIPFWSLAESHGMKSASYFWPGSEAEISGHRPSYYLPYKHETPHQERIDQVVRWFELPADVRPHFVTLYFHDVDSAGHKNGPNSKLTGEVVNKVDEALEQLVSRVEKLKLPINIIIVSDHGMMDLSEKGFESIIKDSDDKKFSSKFLSIGNGPLVHLYKKKDVNISGALESFNRGAKNFKCYTNDNTPKKLNFRSNPRIGDIVCIANYKWSIGLAKKSISMGGHGWSQFKSKDMHGIFFGRGPQFKNIEINTQENVNIFPLMAKILQLPYAHEIDGRLKNMKELLR